MMLPRIKTPDDARAFLARCRAECRGWPHTWQCLADTVYEYRRTTALPRMAMTALQRTDMLFESDGDDMILALEEIGIRLTRESETLVAALYRLDAFQEAEEILGREETFRVLRDGAVSA